MCNFLVQIKSQKFLNLTLDLSPWILNWRKISDVILFAVPKEKSLIFANLLWFWKIIDKQNFHVLYFWEIISVYKSISMNVVLYLSESVIVSSSALSLSIATSSLASWAPSILFFAYARALKNHKFVRHKMRLLVDAFIFLLRPSVPIFFKTYRGFPLLWSPSHTLWTSPPFL